ncbi:MAG TPA: FHA domain-containing protein [Roseiflexaceae bacterium]|nr:FHA domain-containing protein [Roseiflexaceae bacterium]
MYTDAPSNENFPSGSPSSQGNTLSVELVDTQGNVRQAVPLNERGVTIGSAPGNVLVIDSPSVARFHVRINWDGQYASILNLATRKPTLFGGGPLQANELRFWQPGEVLQIGDSRLRLQVGASAAQQHSSDAPVTMPLGALPALVNDSHLDIHLDTGYDMVDLTPDQPTVVKLTLTNRGNTPETVTVGLEGPAASWLRTPQAPIQIRPGAQVGHTLQIMVPRKPENRAGEYEVLIRMRSQTNTGLSVSTVGHWTVMPFSEAKLEVRPPILKVRSMNSGIYTVALRNLGNASMPFEVRISDDQQSLEFAPITASGVLEPGAIDERKIEVQPIREPDDKEQTYNVRVQAFANAQTYTDNATFLQRRAFLPPWALPLAISALVLLLVAGAALWTRQARANQNNQTATQVAGITQTIENMRLNDTERTGTAFAASTQTPLAQTIQALNSNGLMGPTGTVLSQMNGTQIAAAAQITVQAAMIRTMQANGANPNGGQFFGGSGGPGDPSSQTAAAAQQTAAAAAAQVAALQTTVAQQGQAAATQGAGGSGGSGTNPSQGTAAAGSAATQGAQSTQSAANNTQGTQAAQQQTSQASSLNTAVAQTATVNTQNTQTSSTQTASAAAATGTAAVLQTAQAATANAQNTAAAATASVVSATQTASAIAAAATAAAAPASIRIIDHPNDVDANERFTVLVQLKDRNGLRSPVNGVDVELQLLEDGTSTDYTPLLNGRKTMPVINGEARFSDLFITKVQQTEGSAPIVNKKYRIRAVAPTLPNQHHDELLEVDPGQAKHIDFLCYLPFNGSFCSGDVSRFQMLDSDLYGFRAVARDDFGNIATSFSGNITLKLYKVGTTKESTYQGSPGLRFQDGLAVKNDLSLPDEFAGDLVVKVEASALQQDAEIPTFLVMPGAAARMERTNPPYSSNGSSNNDGTSTNKRFPVTTTLDPDNYFGVRVLSAKKNLIANQRVCFMSTAVTDGSADVTFKDPADSENVIGTGREGFLTGSSDILDGTFGIAATKPFVANGRMVMVDYYDVYAFFVNDDCPNSIPFGNLGSSERFVIFYLRNETP